MSAAHQSLEHRRQRSERLKGVAADTPMGRFLRCYWHPVAALAELDTWPVKKVRLLGEDLALFRAEDGTLGLVADRCAHRGASLSCGMTDGARLRCAYHGWAFERDGSCVETPAEPRTSSLKQRVSIAGYPVEELGGLVWAYLGKRPAPLLPRFEQLAVDGLVRSVSVTDLPCSWLAAADNSMDPVHLEYLHMRYMNWVRKRQGEPPIAERHHVKIDFEPFEYGIIKKRLWEGESEDAEEWRVGHPLILPGTLFLPYSATWVRLQFRVPVDVDRTRLYWYDAREPREGETLSPVVKMTENPFSEPNGAFIRDKVNAQDMTMWVTQGPTPDHLAEHLTDSDRGIALFRRILHEQLDRVECGEDPVGVIRDPAKNEPYVRLPIERHIGYSLAGASASANVSYADAV
jgi:5,5'-dehydrodivanillate O-demethylase